MRSATAHESYAFQEEKHFSSFSSRKEFGESLTYSGGDSISKAIQGGGHLLHAIRGGDTASGGEEEDKFAFNFPGPNAMPLHASDGSTYESWQKKTHTPLIREIDDDLNSISSGGFGGKVKRYPNQPESVSGSQISEENYVFNSKSSSSSKLGRGNPVDNTKSGTTILSSSSNTSNNWTLSPTESQKRNVFSPQRSSTMINKSNKTASTTTLQTTEMSSSTRSNRSLGNSSTAGDRIVYERIPVTHESSHHKILGSDHTLSKGLSVESERSEMNYRENNSGRHAQDSGHRHVSSLTVGESVSGAPAGHLWNSSASSVASTSSLSHTKSKNTVQPGKKGEYTIEVKFAEQEVVGSPFVAKAFDMRKLIVSEMPSIATRDKPVCFNIDASEAGSGNIEIRVNGGHVPCNVQNKGNHRFAASFIPENARPHVVEISFNDTAVVGSPWTINIVDRKGIILKAKEKIPCHKKAAVLIHSNNQKLADDDLDVFVKGIV